MCNRRDVLDQKHIHARRGQGADGGLTSGTGAADAHFQRTDAMFARLVGGVHRGLLGGEGSALALPAEAERTRSLPRQHVALLVGDGNDGVVERSLDMRDTHRDVLLLALLELLALAFFRFGACGACYWFRHFSQFSVISCQLPVPLAPAPVSY